ncbi:hypothetical protein ACIBL3_46385 [Kribbella sp. NPDC050124]|uniref:hypothetical protein n=1 Tax=Kribbella sp. NPDC050124 TaxID=3364114 RepID=UPI003790D300
MLVVVDDGEEVPGLTTYGLTTRYGWHSSVFPSDAWVGAPEVSEFMLYGVTWEVMSWDVRVTIWPTGDEFVSAVRRTLRAMIDGGCRVAWVGAEGFPFCDPPGLFDPACMSGGVLAWMTDAGDFDCRMDPDRPVARASDEILLALRNHATGLADVTDIWPD